MTTPETTQTVEVGARRRRRRPESVSAVAAAVSGARNRDVPTYAPAAFERAVSYWRSAQTVTGGGDETLTSAVEQAATALADAEERAERSRLLVGDLARVRTSVLRGDLERLHAPEVLNRADEHFRRAIEYAENGDEDLAREQADAARDAFREATLRSIELGPVVQLEAAIQQAELRTSHEGIQAANAELASIRDALAEAHRGEVTVAQLRRRIAVGAGTIGSRIDDLLDPGGIFTDPDPPIGEPGLAGKPDPVLTIRVTDRAADSLTVIWRDRSNLDETNILLRQKENEPWEPVAEFGGLSGWTTHTDSNLEPETLYCYRVQSENEQGVVATPLNNRAGGYTRAVKEIGVWRIQLRIRTADVSDAGTDDPIQVRLTSPLVTFSPNGNQRWLDYGPRFESSYPFFRDDFARDRDFTYDLDQSFIRDLSDITMLTIRKDGSDAIGIAEVALLVNNEEVFNRVFGETSSTCLWIDDGDGHSPIYTIWLQELRADSRWQAFVAKDHLPTFTIPNSDLVSRLESLVGHSMHGADFWWGEYHSPAWVEATFLDEERLRVDLDLEGNAPIVQDPEIDINFDLHFTIACNQNAGTATLNVTSENMSANVDFDFLTELFGQILTLGQFSRIEDWFAGMIEEGFQPIVQQLPFDTGGLCPTVRVEQNGDITFRV